MAAAYQLPPVPQPLVIFDHMLTQQTVTLVLKEKSFDDFTIKGLDGIRWMHIEGKIATMHGRKKVFDPSGAHLFDIVKELLHWHATYNCEAEGGGKQYMQVKSKFSGKGPKVISCLSSHPTNHRRPQQSSAPKPTPPSPPRRENQSH